MSRDKHEVLGTCYRVVLATDSRKRSHGSTFEDTVSADPNSQRQKQDNAASSADASLSIDELICKKKKEDSASKLREKVQKAACAKASQSASVVMVALKKMKANVKADKMPSSFAANNPIDEAIEKLQHAMTDVSHSSFSEALLASVKTKTAAGVTVMKAMKAFT